MNKLPSPFVAALALTAGIATPASAAITFTDNTFNLASYTIVGPYKSDPAITTTATQCASCGNPGAGLQIVADFPSGAGTTTAWGFANNGFTYDPSTQGTLLSIAASVDKDLTTTSVGPGFTNTFRPLILQGGSYYLASIPLPTITGPATTGYQTASGTLTADNFTLFDFSTGTFGSTHPNFGGGPIELGLGQISASGGGSAIRIEADYDNLKFELSAVPEPATWLSMLLGFGLIGFTLRRSRERMPISRTQAC